MAIDARSNLVGLRWVDRVMAVVTIVKTIQSPTSIYLPLLPLLTFTGTLILLAIAILSDGTTPG